jgi:hypothetical protein
VGCDQQPQLTGLSQAGQITRAHIPARRAAPCIGRCQARHADRADLQSYAGLTAKRKYDSIGWLGNRLLKLSWPWFRRSRERGFAEGNCYGGTKAIYGSLPALGGRQARRLVQCKRRDVWLVSRSVSKSVTACMRVTFGTVGSARQGCTYERDLRCHSSPLLLHTTQSYH